MSPSCLQGSHFSLSAVIEMKKGRLGGSRRHSLEIPNTHRALESSSGWAALTVMLMRLGRNTFWDGK